MEQAVVAWARQFAESFFEPGGGPAGPVPEGFAPVRSLERTPELLEMLAALGFIKRVFPSLRFTFKTTVRKELGAYSPAIDFMVSEPLTDSHGEPTAAGTPVAWGSIGGAKKMSVHFAEAYSLALAEL